MESFSDDEQARLAEHLSSTSVDYEVIVDEKGAVYFVVDDYNLPHREQNDIEIVSVTRDYCLGCHGFLNVKATITETGKSTEFTIVLCPFKLIKEPQLSKLLQNMIKMTAVPGGEKFFEREAEFNIVDRTAGALLQDNNMSHENKIMRMIDTGSLGFSAYSKLKAIGFATLQLKLAVDAKKIDRSISLPFCNTCKKMSIR